MYKYFAFRGIRTPPRNWSDPRLSRRERTNLAQRGAQRNAGNTALINPAVPEGRREPHHQFWRSVPIFVPPLRSCVAFFPAIPRFPRGSAALHRGLNSCPPSRRGAATVGKRANLPPAAPEGRRDSCLKSETRPRFRATPPGRPHLLHGLPRFTRGFAPLHRGLNSYPPSGRACFRPGGADRT